MHDINMQRSVADCARKTVAVLTSETSELIGPDLYGVTKYRTVRTGPKYKSIRHKKGLNQRVQSVNACDATCTSSIVSNGASKLR